jgi:hypothetical protein
MPLAEAVAGAPDHGEEDDLGVMGSGPRRKRSWERSSSDGFRPIKQVGVAASVGLPLIMSGIFMFAIAYSAGETLLWVLAGGLLGGGLVAAAMGRVI